MTVPFIDLKRFEPGFQTAWVKKITSMSAAAQYIGGQEVESLECSLKDRLRVEHAVSCANGTDALQLALRAMGVGRGDKVLVPNITFWATFEAVVNVGASPVTVDADMIDGGVDITAFEEALRSAKPKAAILAHLYGWGSRHLASLRELCLLHGVMLLEDGAQSYGTEYQDNSIYKGAFVSTTSFYPAKVLGAAGDGGAVFTNDAGVAERVRRLGNHGRTVHYGHSEVGWNSRLDAFQAAFLNLSLIHIEDRIQSRREAAAYYYSKLPDAGIELMKAPVHYVENGYCNVCLVRNVVRKTALEAKLKESGIGFGNIYPGVMSTQEGARPFSAGHFGGRQGELLSSSVLNLPLFAYMQDEELEEVVSVVRSYS